VFAEAEFLGNTRQRFSTNECSVPAGQLTDLFIRKLPHEQARDDKAKHPIAKEFKTLKIALSPPFAGCGAGMGESLFKQIGLGETVSKFDIQARKGSFDNAHGIFP